MMDEVPKCPDCLCAFLGVMVRVEINGSRKRMRIARCPQCGDEYALIKLKKLLKPQEGRSTGAQFPDEEIERPFRKMEGQQ
ncbi:MAG TPA: hypothetical protein ENH62_10900 [Marinobacter sp.]|uniref:Uncharacterized protein n=1 Tax=marine sediment metagenome TaxID=412755 RepID=A0A0F8ZYL4_9ZZZZ|nr:hypothetical protein [Marinobacter sp.]